MHNEYMNFEWKGSVGVENGVAIFTVLESKHLEVELTHYGAAHQLYQRMQKVAQMAYLDGQQDIKTKVQNL